MLSSSPGLGGVALVGFSKGCVVVHQLLADTSLLVHCGGAPRAERGTSTRQTHENHLSCEFDKTRRKRHLRGSGRGGRGCAAGSLAPARKSRHANKSRCACGLRSPPPSLVADPRPRGLRPSGAIRSRHVPQTRPCDYESLIKTLGHDPPVTTLRFHPSRDLSPVTRSQIAQPAAAGARALAHGPAGVKMGRRPHARSRNPQGRTLAAGAPASAPAQHYAPLRSCALYPSVRPRSRGIVWVVNCWRGGGGGVPGP